MKIRIKFAAIALACLSQACVYVSTDGDGLSGEVVTRTSRPAAFDSLAVEGSFEKVTVEICDCEPLVKVRGDERLVEEVTIFSEGGALELGHDRQLVVTSERVNVQIQTPSLEALTLASSADVVIAPLSASVFEVVLSGSGDVTLEGEVDVLDLTLSGSGDVHAYGVSAETVQMTSSGSGDAEVCASTLVDGRLTGSGDLFYDCSPSDVDVASTGSGKISIR